MNDSDPSNKIGKNFVWLAWLIGLAILVFVFQSELDQQYNPNTSPESSLSTNGYAEVKLQQNRQGHYVASGIIDGTPVTFLLDTGASNVSIPAHIAERIGLVKGRSGRAQTANGTITVYETRIEELSIGNIFLYNVRASINPHMNSDEILLGMSALKQLEFRQRGKQLILREYK